MSSIAEAAVPLNHRMPKRLEANTTMKITPETYSGVDVVMIENVERVRSVFDPSLIPAITPIMRAAGTINIITQNINLTTTGTIGTDIGSYGDVTTFNKDDTTFITGPKFTGINYTIGIDNPGNGILSIGN